MTALGTRVEVAIVDGGKITWHPAVVVARSFEAEPHFDVMLKNHEILANQSGDKIRQPEVA